MPAVTGQQRELAEQMLRAGGDGAIDTIARHHLGDLLGSSLVQVETHLRVASAELANHIRQNIARLRVRRADRQASLALIAQLGREAADSARLLQYAHGALDDLLSGGSNAREIAPFAYEDLESELVLEQLDLLADARL